MRGLDWKTKVGVSFAFLCVGVGHLVGKGSAKINHLGTRKGPVLNDLNEGKRCTIHSHLIFENAVWYLYFLPLRFNDQQSVILQAKFKGLMDIIYKLCLSKTTWLILNYVQQ